MLAINGYWTHNVFENTTDEHFTDYLFWFENIIIMSRVFNLPLSGLSYNLKSLHIESVDFNQPINNLPENLEYLQLICLYFNQPVDNLPYNLKYLRIQSCLFNQSLDKLPYNLEYLEIYHNANYNFDLCNLPPNIKKLVLNTNTDYLAQRTYIDLSVLPEKLETLTITTTYKIIASHTLPKYLKQINLFNFISNEYITDLRTKFPSISYLGFLINKVYFFLIIYIYQILKNIKNIIL